MSFLCPKCRRELLNRRKPTCAYCGSPIAEALRLPHDAAAKVERLKADEAKAHREFMDKDLPTGGTPDLPTDFPGFS